MRQAAMTVPPKLAFIRSALHARGNDSLPVDHFEVTFSDGEAHHCSLIALDRRVLGATPRAFGVGASYHVVGTIGATSAAETRVS